MAGTPPGVTDWYGPFAKGPYQSVTPFETARVRWARVAVPRGACGAWDARAVTAPTAERPARTRRRRTRPVMPAGRPAIVMSAVGALWALIVGGIVVALIAGTVWLSAGDGSEPLGSVFGVIGAAFAVVNAVPFGTGHEGITLLPWGWTLLPIALLIYAGRWAATRSRIRGSRDAVLLLVSGPLLYGIVVAVGASTGRRLLDEWTANPVRALLTGIALAAVSMGVGALTSTTAAPLRARVPSMLADALHAGAIALGTLIGVAALLLAVSMTASFGQALDIATYLDAGLVGGLILLLIGLGYLPVLVVWSLAYLLGAPVALAGETFASPFLANAGAAELPAFPLLAAIPQSASPALWALPLFGVAAGVLAGWRVGRGHRGELRQALIASVGAAGLAAVGVGLLALASTGSVGNVRLAGLGPSPVIAAVFAFALLALGAVPTAAATQRIRVPKAADAAAEPGFIAPPEWADDEAEPTTAAADDAATDDPADEPADEVTDPDDVADAAPEAAAPLLVMPVARIAAPVNAPDDRKSDADVQHDADEMNEAPGQPAPDEEEHANG